jgi:hypothetical protein
MLKSVINWLLSEVPMNRLLIIILLLCLVATIVAALLGGRKENIHGS